MKTKDQNKMTATTNEYGKKGRKKDTSRRKKNTQINDKRK